MSARAEEFAPSLGGRWLTAVRVLWLAYAVGGLVLLAEDLPSTFAAMKHVCASQSILNCNNGQLNAQAAHGLQNIGISLGAYAAYSVALLLLVNGIAYIMAGILMARRSADPMVIVTAFAGVLVNISSFQPPHGPWTEATGVVAFLGQVTAGLFFFLFPAGRFVPRWSALLAVGYIFASSNLLPTTAGWAIALYTFFMVSIIALQIYRFRWISTPLQRQQTKLVMVGIGAFIGIYVLALIAFVIDPGLSGQPILFLVVQTAVYLASLPILLSVGFAVLRYRLWDVDVLINRTLVYLALTLVLAAAYIGSVVGLQALFRAITGQSSDLAVAMSTLIIAVLFNPLRRRIQDLIARAFYRRRYNAGQVLSAFGVACRDETDLEQLRAKLTRVVEETMQPRNVSLWLRE